MDSDGLNDLNSEPFGSLQLLQLIVRRSWVLQAVARSPQELMSTGLYEAAGKEFTKLGGKSRICRHSAGHQVKQ